MSTYQKHLTYELSKKTKKHLTKRFLKSFREELGAVFGTMTNDGIATYHNFYSNISSTGGFYKALERASITHGVYDEVYKHAVNLPWYKSDIFDEKLLLYMVEEGIIEMGESSE